MDSLHLVSWSLNGLMMIVLYLMKSTVEDLKQRLISAENGIKAQNEALTDVRVHYLHKDDFNIFKQELWDKLDDLKESFNARR